MSIFDRLPADAKGLLPWQWTEIEPYYSDLKKRPLAADNVDRWMADWSKIYSLVDEVYSRLYVATTADTADVKSKELFDSYLDNIQPKYKAEEQALKEKLLASGLCPRGCELLLKKMQTEAEIFREENLPLLSQEQKLRQKFSSITGSQTVNWQGQERTLAQLRPVYQEQDRGLRQQAWEKAAQRQLQDREAMSQLWREYFELRRRIAQNAGMESFRQYRWKSLHRFDYTPEDCRRFREAIEQVVVPAAQRIYEKRQEALGLDGLRPWDLDVDLKKRPPLKPFSDMSHLISGVSKVFRKLDDELAGYFDLMAQEGLLDLENRKNKRPGGYCITFNAAGRPFIFANAVGTHGDVQTLLHESGHAFHAFRSRAALPYAQQAEVPMEFNEVASMAMELLAGPHLEAFYTKEDMARALVEHLEGIILFWPYMAVVDGFQHWAYENPQKAMDPTACDQVWDELYQRFMKGIDFSGYEDFRSTGWQRRLHIYIHPFYYVEYGLAQLGAVQVWANARKDPARALALYKQALSLGGTRPLPELYAAAGAKFSFEAETLKQAVAAVEERME